MTPFRILCWGGLTGWLLVGFSHGLTVSDADWRVHINLPDQNASSSTASAEEFAIRDALLQQVALLGTGDTGTLATYTFSAASTMGRSEQPGGDHPTVPFRLDSRNGEWYR